jgi:hypothetical protein
LNMALSLFSNRKRIEIQFVDYNGSLYGFKLASVQLI